MLHSHRMQQCRHRRARRVLPRAVPTSESLPKNQVDRRLPVNDLSSAATHPCWALPQQPYRKLKKRPLRPLAPTSFQPSQLCPASFPDAQALGFLTGAQEAPHPKFQKTNMRNSKKKSSKGARKRTEAATPAGWSRVNAPDAFRVVGRVCALFALRCLSSAPDCHARSSHRRIAEATLKPSFLVNAIALL